MIWGATISNCRHIFKAILVLAVLLMPSMERASQTGQALAADPLELDYSKPPDWWPMGVRYANPPQKKKPMGWKGDWPPDKKLGHDPEFWTKYHKLKPKAPKEFGKPGLPETALGNGYSGNRTFTARIPPISRLNTCGVARFTGQTSKLVGGVCSFVPDPVTAISDLCKSAINDRGAANFCKRACARKINSKGRRGCNFKLIKPPAFINWTCTDKEAGVLIACNVTHLCQCLEP